MYFCDREKGLRRRRQRGMGGSSEWDVCPTRSRRRDSSGRSQSEGWGRSWDVHGCECVCVCVTLRLAVCQYMCVNPCVTACVHRRVQVRAPTSVTRCVCKSLCLHGCFDVWGFRGGIQPDELWKRHRVAKGRNDLVLGNRILRANPGVFVMESDSCSWPQDGVPRVT